MFKYNVNEVNCLSTYIIQSMTGNHNEDTAFELWGLCSVDQFSNPFTLSEDQTGLFFLSNTMTPTVASK